MKYVGSKNRLSKELAPIIQSYINDDTKGYIEPFVGGANMIDKIKCKRKIGIDLHEELIELLKYIQDLDNELPQHISEDEYIKVKNNKDNYPKWYVGLVGFCASFSAKYFGGYARSFKADGVIPRDMSNEGVRNIEKQRKGLTDIKFIHGNFLNINIKKINNCVIYCDIPYRQTDKYYEKNKKESFPYEKFYDWAVRLQENNNIVLISEYNINDDRFEVVWEKEHKVGIDQGKHSKRVERLYKVE